MMCKFEFPIVASFKDEDPQKSWIKINPQKALLTSYSHLLKVKGYHYKGFSSTMFLSCLDFVMAILIIDLEHNG